MFSDEYCWLLSLVTDEADLVESCIFYDLSTRFWVARELIYGALKFGNDLCVSFQNKYHDLKEMYFGDLPRFLPMFNDGFLFF